MEDDLFFFKCSVSDDLYGACKKIDGATLPTPGGGKWLPLSNQSELGDAQAGFNMSESQIEIEKWGCHWFTSKGTTDIIWE